MKRIYTLLFTLAFSVASFAATINVSVTNNVFTPANFSANVGDVVLWTWTVAGTHSVVPVSIPAGAATMNSGVKSSSGSTYSYTITAEGLYNYQCGVHGATMVGSFTVSGFTGVNDLTVNVTSSAYPNPFKNKVTLAFTKADNIKIYNILGTLITSVEVPMASKTLEMDLSTLPAGVYFYVVSNEGVLTESKKIIKQ